jgi:UDP-N-acetylglucosamine 2-epimerase (non-hydrolysing)
MRIVNVFGTRPEAIEMVPAVKVLQNRSEFGSVVCSAKQRKEMLSPLFQLFSAKHDYDARVGKAYQTSNCLFACTPNSTSQPFEEQKPDRMLVRGDITAAELAISLQNIPLGHVEIRLRSGNLNESWLDELDRWRVELINGQLYAPKKRAKQNLRQQNLL